MPIIEKIKFSQNVDVYPIKLINDNTFAANGESDYILTSSVCISFIKELIKNDQFSVIEDTLQSLSQKQDGTLLLSSFPGVVDIEALIENSKVLPQDFKNVFSSWKKAGAIQVNFDFVKEPNSDFITPKELLKILKSKGVDLHTYQVKAQTLERDDFCGSIYLDVLNSLKGSDCKLSSKFIFLGVDSFDWSGCYDLLVSGEYEFLK